MKTLLIVGFTATALTIAVAASRQDSGPSPQAANAAPQPWQVGQCYRVFPENRDTFYTFKVLEPPAGPWVRVQSAPSSPPVPGSRPPVSQWLNSTSAFLVQEWTCD